MPSPTSRCRSCRRPTRSAASTTSSPPRRPPAAACSSTARAIVDKAAHCAGCHTLNAARGAIRHARSDDLRGRNPGVQGSAAEERLPEDRHVRHAATPSSPTSCPTTRSIRAIRFAASDFSTTAAWRTVFDFLRARFFTLDDDQRRDLEQFVLAFDTTFAPIVGQQITLTSGNAAVAGPRIDLMIARATTDFALIDQPGAKECDLIAKAVIGGAGARLPAERRQRRLSERSRRRAAVERRPVCAPWRASTGQPVTYTCVPPGEGVRLGLDRDGDGFFDRDEIDAGTDPADATSLPVPPTQPTRRQQRQPRVERSRRWCRPRPTATSTMT